MSVRQLNEVSTDIDPISLLPVADEFNTKEVKNSCAVPGLTPRSIIIYGSDDAQFLLTYPRPYSQNLYDHLASQLQIRAFELVGERIKYSRLKRMLGNV